MLAPTDTRPHELPRLLSTPDNPPLSEGGVADVFAQGAREKTLEEQLEELRQEVAVQAQIADDEEAKLTPQERAALDATEPEELEKLGVQTDAEFVDEGKNIIWPSPRRVIQLTVLTVAAQVAFFVYIISLNSFLNSVPEWFIKFVEIVKGMNSPLPPV
ncbi:unnamed protein product [Choristocarpus tenellus]